MAWPWYSTIDVVGAEIMSVLKFKVDNEEVAVDIVKGGTSVADYIKDKIASSSTAASGRVSHLTCNCH